MKNYAVVANRYDSEISNDNFPTPPWATRALLENIHNYTGDFKPISCLEPACGQGHMSKVLKEYFDHVTSFDIVDYGYGSIEDFLKIDWEMNYDWVITNPPFNKAEEFIKKSLNIAEIGVAMLVRTSFIESVGRYERLFKNNFPTYMLQFSERVPMFKGRLNKTGTTATSYCWLVWYKKANNTECKLKWIPPCRKRLEKDTDYIDVVI